jgi:hypothetical protein
MQEHIDQKLNGKMDTLYQKLNQKLDRLVNQNQTTHHRNRNTHAQPRAINLTKVKLTREHSHTLTLGPNYTMEKKTKRYINNLIIETESAISSWNQKYRTCTDTWPPSN